LVPADSLALVLKHIPGTRAPLSSAHPWNVLIEATSSTPDLDPVELLQALLARAIEHKLVKDAMVASSEAQADALWKIRDSISEAERAEGPSTAHDISVAVADMPDFLIEAKSAVEKAFPGTIASAFGHLGDGNLHFHVRAGSRAVPGWNEGEGHEIEGFIDDLVTEAGGSISAEHGIGQMKRGELERLANPGDLAALRAIKKALDPLGLMNPGKLV
jgi:FAD/FMN-containing dehydrogenase